MASEWGTEVAVAEEFLEPSPPREVHLAPGALDRARRAVLAAAPREACGLLLGCRRGALLDLREALVVANLDPGEGGFQLSPIGLRRAFELAEERGLALLGVWHSHPTSDARPSRRDLEGTPLSWCQVILAGPQAAEVAVWWRGEETLERLNLCSPRKPCHSYANNASAMAYPATPPSSFASPVVTP
jgi:proteasome lid subunit RPN8/RPN11